MRKCRCEKLQQGCCVSGLTNNAFHARLAPFAGLLLRLGESGASADVVHLIMLSVAVT